MQTRASATDEALVQAHDRLLKDPGFQFDRVGFTPPKAPGWLHWIGDAIQFIAQQKRATDAVIQPLNPP